MKNDEFYTIKTLFEKKRLQIYDLNTLSLKKESEIKLKYDNNKVNPINYFIFGEKVVLISAGKDKSANKAVYYLHELNSNGTIGKTVELARFDLPKIKIATNKTLEEHYDLPMRSFRYVISEDKNKILAFYKSENQKDPNSLLYESVTFNNDFEKEEVGECVFPFKSVFLKNLKLSNEGVLFVLGGETKKIDSKTTTIGSYLFTFDPKGNFYDQLELDIEKKIIDLNCKIFDDGSLLVFGLYSEQGTCVNGTFYLKVKNNLSIDFLALDEFENDFLPKQMTEKEKVSADELEDYCGAKNYFVLNLIIKENGEFVILAEQFSYKMDLSTFVTFYFYDDVIISSASPSGKINHHQLINKSQINTNGLNDSFLALSKENSIILIFNRSKKEINESEKSIDKSDNNQSKHKTVVAIIEIDKDGEVSEKELFSLERKTIQNLHPFTCQLLSNNEVLLITTSSPKNRIFGKLELE